MQEETREYQKVISYLSQMIAGGELAIGSANVGAYRRDRL